MAIVEMLPPAEFALQLDNPEGDAGRAVADLLNEANYVLEIGFGNGRTVPDVISQATDIQYTGIDISATMLEEASRFNAALVAAGRASFHLGAAAHMPFADGAFDRVFSTGVIHFWAEPDASLAEVRRVMRAAMLMG